MEYDEDDYGDKNNLGSIKIFVFITTSFQK